jgi:hypothetical protein
MVTTDDVGWLNELRVFHDNYRGGDDKGPGWFLNFVRINDPEAGIEWEIPFNRWLAKTADDGRIDITYKVPIGGVRIEQRGEVRQTYLGYDVERERNGLSVPVAKHTVFNQVYKTSTFVNLDSSYNIKTSAKPQASQGQRMKPSKS